MPEYPVPYMTDVSMEGVLKALGDPTRLAIGHMLADGAARPKSEVWDAFATSKATCAHHFKTLREAGLVVYEIHGRTHDMRLRGPELEERFPGLIDAVTGAETAE